MKIIETTVYQCDYCGKKQYRKCDMTKHEKWCKKNPKNDHKCFQYCVHLVRDREDCYDEGESPKTRRTFTCSLLNKKMYSYIAERRDIVRNLYDCERMPLQCDSYKDRMDIYEIDDFKNYEL